MNRPAQVTVEDHFNEALALHRQSRLAEADAAYHRVLEQQPRHVASLTFLSVIAIQSGHPERALEFVDRALAAEPGGAVIHVMRGHSLVQLGQPEAAVVSYERALGLQPDLADGWFHHGKALQDLGRYREAVASYDRAIGLMPGMAELHFNRALALHEIQRYDLALASYERALAIDPRYAEAHFGRGNALQALQRLPEALAAYDHAITIRADHAKAFANRGNVQGELEDFEAAFASYAAAIAIDPTDGDVYCNRANLLSELGRYEEALQNLDQALALHPGHALARYSRAFVNLVQGNFMEGWRDFEWRWQNEHCITSRERRDYPQPLWSGAAPLAGKVLLVHCEQGLGDTLQFCRYIPLLAARGASVIFEAPRPLLGLLRSLGGAARLVTAGEPLPPFDCYCPLMSLPMALGTTLETIPAAVPYLRAGAARMQQWQAKLGERHRPRVGLVWSGGFRPGQPELLAVHARRNIALSVLAGVLQPGMEFYSLQKGQPALAELEALRRGNRDAVHVLDHTADLHDFEDTAALIEQLDLVISVDTSTAHLAGALGKPVWLLNRFDTCWRWLLNRNDSPWYPTLRLYRQERRADWAGVIGRVRADLERFADDWNAVPQPPGPPSS